MQIALRISFLMAIDIGTILVDLFFLVLLARIAGLVCEAVKIPAVIGEILMGMAISNIIIGGVSIFSFLQLSSEANFPIFQIFADLGVIFLLFTVGLVTPFSELRKIGRTAALVATFGVILPFFAGFAIIAVFNGGLLEGLFMGAAMTATSVGITARVVKDLGVIDSIEAKVIIAAAVIDDVLGLIVLAMVSGVGIGGSLDILDVAVVAGLAVGFVLIVMYISTLIPKARKAVERWNHAKGRKSLLPTHWSPLPFALILCFGLSALASFLSLAAIVGAFLGGMLFAEFRDTWPCEEKFAPINEFLVPFFFLLVGINVSLGSIFAPETMVLVILISLAAILTKYIGCGYAARKIGKGSGMIVGVGMMPRGEVGIIIAAIALGTGIFPGSLYATVVAMSLITTLAAPALIAYSYRRKDRLFGKGLRSFKG